MATITFSCQSCQQMLRVAGENAGKRTKCTKCGTILTIPGVTGVRPAAVPMPPPPPPRYEQPIDDYDEEPLTKPNYNPARIGLLIGMIGTFIVTGGLTFQLIGEILVGITVMSQSTSRGMFQAADILAKVGISIFLVGWLVLLVGSGFMMIVRNKHGAMVFGILTLLLGIAGLILFIVFIVVPSFSGLPLGLIRSSFGTWFLMYLTQLILIATWVFLALYLRSAAKIAGAKRLGTWMHFILTCILAGVYFLVPLVIYIIMSSITTGSFGLAVTFLILRWLMLAFHIAVALLLAFREGSVRAALAKRR